VAVGQGGLVVFTRFAVSSWNVSVDAVPAPVFIEALTERGPGIIGLEELGPDLAAAIESDAGLRELFPYRVLQPATDWTGMGLLSSWAIAGTPR
jgi:hypothetical protein